MEISSSSSVAQAAEVRQATLLKRAITDAQSQILELIQSVSVGPLDKATESESSNVGLVLNVKA